MSPTSDEAVPWLDALSDGIVGIDADGVVRYVSPRVTDITGWPADVLLGRQVIDFAGPDQQRVLAAALADVLDDRDATLTDTPLRLPVAHATGHQIDVDLTISSRRTADGGRTMLLRPAAPATLIGARGLAGQLVAMLSGEDRLAEAVAGALRLLADAAGADAARLWLAGADGLSVAASLDQPDAFETSDALAPPDEVRRSYEEDAPVRAEGSERRLALPLTQGQTLGVVELSGSELATDAETTTRLGGAVAEMGPVIRRRLEQDERDVRAITLELAIAAGQLGMWSYDIETGKVEWSPRLEELFGLEPGSFPGSYEAFIDLIHPDDRAEVEATVGSTIQTGNPHRVLHRVVLRDRSIRWIEGRGLLVRDPLGRPSAMTGVAMDVTDRVENEQRLEAEARTIEAVHAVGSAVSSTLVTSDVAAQVVRSAHRLTRARLAVMMYEADGDAWTFSAAGEGVDAINGDWVDWARDVISPLLDRGAFRTDGSAIGDPETGSVLAAPIRTTSRRLQGILVFSHPEPGWFEESAERLVDGIAGQTGVALENARRFEREQRVAATFQQSLLPRSLPVIDNLEIYAHYRPGSEGMQVGGDWYDAYRRSPTRVGITVGDTCGHGVRAAADMSLFRQGFLGASAAGATSAEAIQCVNELARSYARTTATLCHAEIDSATGRLAIWSAGHLAPVVRRADGSAEVLDTGPTACPMLGVAGRVDPEPTVAVLDPGDTLLMYSDGLIERRGESIDDGVDRLVAAAADASAGDARDLTHHVLDRLLGPTVADDVVIVAVRRLDGGAA